MYLNEYKFMIKSDNALWIIQLQPEIDTLIPPNKGSEIWLAAEMKYRGTQKGELFLYKIKN